MSDSKKVAPPRRTKIEKIEHLSCRQVTFSKRRKGLFSKVEKFSQDCDAKIGVIVFSNTNKLYKKGFPSIEEILEKRNEYTAERAVIASDEGASPSSSDSIRAIAQLMEENKALSLDGLRLKGMELDDMGLRELNELEKQICDGIELIQERKKLGVGNNLMLENSNRLDGNSSNNQYGIRGSSAQGSSQIVLNQVDSLWKTCLHL